MKVLLLTQILPYPPDAGPRIKTWHVLRHLIEMGHEVTLVTFIRPDEEPYIDDVRKLCKNLFTIPIYRSRIRDIKYFIQSNFTGRPFLVERDDVRAMRDMVKKQLSTNPVHIIHADQLTMTQFALDFQENFSANSIRPYRLFDAHNATWTVIDRMRQTSPWYLRPIFALETKRIKKFEGEIVKKFDHTCAVTEIDRTALLNSIEPKNVEQCRGKISVIPIAVDTQKYLPIQRQTNSYNILTLGTLHYPPNADGIRWFMRDIFPLIVQQIPEVTLTVVGKNPPQDFIQTAVGNSQIRVTGYVPDLDPYLQQSGVIVVPVRAGGGMRVRILEAFSRAIPVVTTTVGLEGIDASPGIDVLVEDDSEKFARAVVRVLKNPEIQNQLAKNSRMFVEKNYDWRAVLGKIDAIYASVSK
jgi:polysaccharide biosynthesis protein PslH